MKTARILILSLVCTAAAYADFSYTQTRKSTGGMMGGMANAMGNPVTKQYIKGGKMKMDQGSRATIIDVDAQTITAIDNDQKTYTVTKFSDLTQTMKDAGAEVQVDVKETGQHKQINGYNASQAIMTMTLEGMQQAPGMKMQMELELWLSPDVPGAHELRSFFQKNGDKFPWASLGAGAGNAQMQKQMAAVQRKLATMGGVPVMQVIRMKAAGAGAPSDAQMAQADAARQQAMAQMEAMRKQGGAQAQAVEQAMARMGAMRGMGGSGGSLIEMTMESSEFSTASIPDAVFAIPAGYTKK
jgi:hypothetical protein